MERSYSKRSMKLDLIASTQLEVAQLEAKLNEDNVVLITLKQRHLAELKVNLPVAPADPSAPSAAAFAALSAQLHIMMGILRQIAGTPGIDPSMAASIQQVFRAHPTMRADMSQPDQVEIKREQQWNETQLRQTVLNQ